MTDTVTAKLAEWEALAEGATKGPWTFEPAGESECGEPQCCYEYWDNRIWGNGVALAESHMLSDEDAAFIAAARHMVPALLGFVREVRAGHQPVTHGASNGWVGDPFTECRECRRTWPCPTVQALTKRIGGEG